MKVSARDLLELAGLLLVVLTLWEATHQAWPTIAAGALAVLYLSHFWVIRAEFDSRKVSAAVAGRGHRTATWARRRLRRRR